MRFLGIDPGLVHTGFAIIDDNQVLASGVIKKTGSTIDRIHAIAKNLTAIIEEYQPGYSGIETAFFGKNPKTLIQSAQLIGAILYILKENDIMITQFHPNVLKRIITGHGRASKSQVTYMVKRLLNLSKDLKSDEADAIAIALAASFYYDHRD